MAHLPKPNIMKRQVLFIGFDSQKCVEISDFAKHHDAIPYFANSTEQAIRALDNHTFASVVLNMQKLADAAILRYINLHKPEIKVLITTSEEFDNIINIFSNGHFRVVKTPLRLGELEEAM